MTVLRDFQFGNDLWDPSNRFETSWLIPPYALFAARALFSLYAFTVHFFVLGWYCTHADEGGCTASANTFSYFTVLTYWGIAFYMAVAAFHTFTYARYGAAALDKWPRPLQALHALFYTTVTCYPFLVTVVYWTILHQPFEHVFDAWSNVSQHALNSFFALFEILIPRTNPSPPVHMAWIILVLACYLALAYLSDATEGFYVYPFLDPATERGYVAAYVFGIAAIILVVFGIVWGLVWTRKWLTETKLGMEGKFASGGARNSWTAHELAPGSEMGGLYSPNK